MSKKRLDLDLPDEPTAVVEEESKPIAGFTNSAFSIVPVGRDYSLVEIKFNLETGDTSPIITLGTYPSHQEAQERFKIVVVQRGAF
jgi:hypothetical protein